MKTRNLLLTFCCMAALTACTSNDEPMVNEVKAPQPMSITLSLADPATRAQYAEQEDGSLKATWSEGDAVSVLWYDSDWHNDIFTLDAASVGKTSGTFTGTFTGTENTTKKALLLYPANEALYTGIDTEVLSIENQDGTLESLSKYDIMVAEELDISANALPAEMTLKKQVCVMKMPKGLQFFTSQPTGGKASLKMSFTSIASVKFIINGGNISKLEGTLSLSSISFDTDGKLAQDYYVAFYVNEGSGTQPKITVTANGSDYEFKLSKTFYGPNGTIRTLTQATLGEPKALG